MRERAIKLYIARNRGTRVVGLCKLNADSSSGAFLADSSSVITSGYNGNLVTDPVPLF